MKCFSSQIMTSLLNNNIVKSSLRAEHTHILSTPAVLDSAAFSWMMISHDNTNNYTSLIMVSISVLFISFIMHFCIFFFNQVTSVLIACLSIIYRTHFQVLLRSPELGRQRGRSVMWTVYQLSPLWSWKLKLATKPNRSINQLLDWLIN